jgi:dolichol-phosphate mannosyltransferase
VTLLPLSVEGRAEAVSRPEKFALIIPTLREAANLPKLLARVKTALDQIPIESEIIVVDDDSRDGTAEIVEHLAVTDKRLRVVVREGQRGLAGAVLHGWRMSDATLLGVMDADLQHPPELLPQLLGAMLCGADLAVGSRYKAGGSVGAWSPVRRFVSNSATWLTRPLLDPKLRVRDPMSGFFIVQRQSIEGLCFQSTGFKLLLELLVRGRIAQVEEVCFAFGVREAGKSKASMDVAREYLRLLVRLYCFRGETAAVDAMPDVLPLPSLSPEAVAALKPALATGELKSLVLQ